MSLLLALVGGAPAPTASGGSHLDRFVWPPRNPQHPASPLKAKRPKPRPLEVVVKSHKVVVDPVTGTFVILEDEDEILLLLLT